MKFRITYASDPFDNGDAASEREIDTLADLRKLFDETNQEGLIIYSFESLTEPGEITVYDDYVE